MAMERLGPWEARPAIAIAVSGGCDSLALALLLKAWGRARLLGLVVDHGLRAEAAGEAAQAAAWLERLGIPARVLRWQHPAGGQAAARKARYDLLAGAAAEAGILHLATAHHADDDAETRRMRAARAGDAAWPIASSRALGPVRLIRPLLAWPKRALQATCVAAGQPWIEDPSNRNPRFERARLRQQPHAPLPPLPQDPPGLTAWLAAAACQQPEGWLTLDAAAVQAAAPDLLATALRRLVTALQVRDEPLPRAPFQRLAGALAQGQGGTVAGFGLTRQRGGWLLARTPPRRGEKRALPLSAPGPWIWDRRLSVEATAPLPEGAVLDRLGPQTAAALPGLAHLPGAVRAELPGLWRGGAIYAAPGHERAGLRLHLSSAGAWPAAPS